MKQIFDIKKKTFFGDECIKPNPLTSFFRNLEGKQSEQAKNFLKEYCKQNFSDANKMNCIVHVALKSFEDFFEEILLLFLSLNQDVAIFSKILWEGNEGAYLTGGNVTVGNLLTKKWENIQNIVERSDIGIKLVPIKQYVAKKIAENQKRDREERKRRGGLPMWG
ncbi:MAG: hypothetical protein ACPGXL_03215 [Chitinophagales bacterium]